ncbi:MAG: sigma-70 family RNA polymerase sigma factor [Rhodopseudomonas sp.]|nr:sigma-70 family RNA polymerase sigma factor [Rhodopseudomonas sp.]
MDLEANRRLIAAALARVPGGDRAALQTVYRLTSAKLFGVALRILGERSEAEDVLQEVFVTVWRKAGDFDGNRASPMTWLIAIVRNRAIDRLRASKNNRRMDPIDDAVDVADTAPLADDALEMSEDNARLHGCLDGLAREENVALRGAFFDGNTYEDLAQRMNVPLGTMKSRIRRAMIKLKLCLEATQPAEQST